MICEADVYSIFKFSTRFLNNVIAQEPLNNQLISCKPDNSASISYCVVLKIKLQSTVYRENKQ